MEDYELKIDIYKPLRDVVFESIRGAILSGTIKPGERLMEVQMAEKLGVSRTPIREAIRKLELEGLVIMVPRKGVYVADLSVKDITDVLEIRAALEGLAASLAATRVTDEDMEAIEKAVAGFEEAIKGEDFELIVERDMEFHASIFKATNNEKLIALINNLREQIQRFRVMILKNSSGLKALSDEHREIADAICTRDTMKAQNLATTHIVQAEYNILKMVENTNEAQ